MEINEREFARMGLRAAAIEAVTEFPDILPELNALANGTPKIPAANGKRHLSAEARARISRAQKRRWKRQRQQG